MRARLRAADRPVRGNACRRAPQFDLRSRGHGHFAYRIFDADLLLGFAADSSVLGPARPDAGLGPHLGDVFRRAGYRVSADRRAFVRSGWRFLRQWVT
jgi:hypothetical protein